MKQQSATALHSLWALTLGLFLTTHIACMNNALSLREDDSQEQSSQKEDDTEYEIKPENLGEDQTEGQTDDEIIEQFIKDGFLVTGKKNLGGHARKAAAKTLKKRLSLQEKRKIAQEIKAGFATAARDKLLYGLGTYEKNKYKFVKVCKKNAIDQGTKLLDEPSEKIAFALGFLKDDRESAVNAVRELCESFLKPDKDFINYILDEEIDSNEIEKSVNDYLESSAFEKIITVLYAVKKEALQEQIVRDLLEEHKDKQEELMDKLFNHIITLNTGPNDLSTGDRLTFLKILFENYEVPLEFIGKVLYCSNTAVKKLAMEHISSENSSEML